MILNHLVNNLVEQNINFVLLKDVRCPKLQSEEKVPLTVTLSPDSKTRNAYYRAHRNSFRSVLCFGNIPPQIKLKVPVHTYLHNVSLLKIPSDYSFSLKIKSLLKKIYIKHYSKNTSTWIVQTSNTAQLVSSNLAQQGQDIKIFPFYHIPDNIHSSSEAARTDYVFIGDHTSAKGHEYLVEAWIKLSRLGIKATLHLTVSDQKFIDVIDEARSQGANIINHGKISFDEVVRLYSISKATVYPSLNESLGLGIVEALEAGCDVIGCDLPYMHSVCQPSVFFSPCNSDSIVKAVLKYEKTPTEKSKLKIHDSINEFINYLTSQNYNA